MQFNQEAIQVGAKEVQKITLTNNQKMSVEILSLGGIITRIMVPDAHGNIENVVLGYKELEDYLDDGACFGALIGRTAGRIGGAQFTLNGITYKLPVNNGESNLHGGLEGFNKKVWQVHPLENTESVGVRLSYVSAHLEEGYPGNVNIEITYTLTDTNEFSIHYKAKSDQDTLLNLTNHSYFNLSGNAKAPITEHNLQVCSDYIAQLDENSIPTGQLLSVQQVEAFNFNTLKQIGKQIDDESTKLQSGYDHPWVLREGSDYAVLYEDPLSKRRMTIQTDQKAVVIYSMNFADEPKYLQNGEKAQVRRGICFETQSLPIGYHDCFIEGSILKANQAYERQTSFKFDWGK